MQRANLLAVPLLLSSVGCAGLKPRLPANHQELQPTQCSVYQDSREWLPDAYVDAATSACRGTPSNPTYNCIRWYLQDRMARWPRAFTETALSLKAARRPNSLSSMNRYNRWVSSAFVPRIYKDHLDAYRRCGCPAAPAAYPAWEVVVEVPLPEFFIPLSIQATGSCSGAFGSW